MAPCGECGFTYDEGEALGAAATIRVLAVEIAALLGGDEAAVRARPDASTWSALEYGCHVRDVLLVQRERVLLVRRAGHVAPEPMGRDERVDHDGYAEQQPEAVARQLGDAASLFANVLDRLDSASWDRQLTYNYPPPPKHRSLRWVAVHTVHELTHHLHDIQRGLPPTP
jgi:hypothetical protein